MVTQPFTVPLHPIVIADVPFECTTLDAAARWLLDEVDRSGAPARAVRLANAFCVALASQRPDYAALLQRDGVNFPDGASVVAAMNLLSRNRRSGRVRGPSFFQRVLELGVERQVRHFFLGSTSDTLDALQRAVLSAYPGVQIAGVWAPPFADIDDAYLDGLVARAAVWGADIVWVGMGTPKQDFVAQALAERADVFAVGVGAAFDFAAGTVREAPRWVQNSGFEWAFRFLAEPRRLWRRYVFGNSRFLWLVLKQWLSRRVID